MADGNAQSAFPLGLADFSADNVRTLLIGYAQSAAHSASLAELAGESASKWVYKPRKAEIGRAIALLKRAHAEMTKLEKHVHEWNENDYCSICNQDGRA